nr:MAG TPA: nucelotide kinase [Caudoviricetes sp.]
MSKVKVGDRVVRRHEHRNYIWEDFCRHIEVPSGAPMRITKVLGESALILEGHDKAPWSIPCFHLVEAESAPERSKSADAVNSPQHYQLFPDLEAIVVIARSMTQNQFYGYCLGNRLKYRLRAGNKDKLEQDIAKSDKYLELYEQHKGECIDA